MMSSSDDLYRRRNSKRDSPQALKKFVEELSWLLQTYSDLDFRALKDVKFSRSEHFNQDYPNYTHDLISKKRPNTMFLVGVLPGLFIDEAIFPTNEDIAEFAYVALGVTIPRWNKKSKFELIGHVVCHASLLNDEDIDLLVRALSGLVVNDRNIRKIMEDRKLKGEDWNETIQNLLRVL